MNGKQRMVEQSKQWLCDALINLMTKENFQDISITEIAQTAELSRKTFYHSFKNKEAVINYLCDQLFDQYFEQLLQQKPQVGEMMLKTTFDIFLNFWWQKRDLIQSTVCGSLACSGHSYPSELCDGFSTRWSYQYSTCLVRPR